MDTTIIVPGLSAKRGWRAVERHTKDSKPNAAIVDISTSSSSVTMPTNEAIISVPSTTNEISVPATCTVCKKYQSRYTCPKCQTPYCSVDCYRNHTTSTSVPSDVDGDLHSSSQPISACTEHFYKQRVSSILNLEAKETMDKTQKILNDHYLETIQAEQLAASHDVGVEDLSDQLYELLDLLDDAQNDDLSHKQIMAMMPQNLKEEFQRDLQDGKLQDIVLQQWYPWWRRHLGSADNKDSQTLTRNSSTRVKTLDKRILKVSEFHALCKRPLKSPQDLLFNLVDILYAYCWTVRLYHGVENILGGTKEKAQQQQSDFLEIEACTTILQASNVLNADARYTCLEETLLASTTASTKAYPSGCNTMWTELVEDCAVLLSSKRFVARTLLEISDIMKAGIKRLKCEDFENYDRQDFSHDKNKDETIAKLRSLRKKIDFYLSWSQKSLYAQSFGEEIQNEVMGILERWKLDTKKEGIDSKLNALKMPQQFNKASSSSVPSSPLLVEISSKQRQ